MRSDVALCLALVAVAACGPGVHDLEFEGKDLLQVEGAVDLAALAPLLQGGALYGALAWAETPRRDPECELPTDNPRVAELCFDPHDFVPQELHARRGARLDGDGRFTLPLRELPSVTATFGPYDARLAYGSLIIFELLGDDPAEELVTLDIFGAFLGGVPVAATYLSGDEPQERLLFREGGFDSASAFYPEDACALPASGFSAMRFDGNADCSIDDLAEPLQARPLTLASAVAFGCIARGFRSYQAPPVDEPADVEEWVCVNDEVALAVTPEATCPNYLVFPLVGCWTQLDCDLPEWDLRDDPPSWWPCP